MCSKCIHCSMFNSEYDCEGICDHFEKKKKEKKRIFTLTTFNFRISNPSLELGMVVFVVTNC